MCSRVTELIVHYYADSLIIIQFIKLPISDSVCQFLVLWNGFGVL